jgi:lipopolysaccharide export LptBFGC system permease protein LptF
MPNPSTGQLLRRLAAAFITSFVALTIIFLARFAAGQLPGLQERGAPTGAMADAVLFALPFIAALTIPMAVLVAVLWVFTRLGSAGRLPVAGDEHARVRQLLLPVLCASAGIAAVSLVLNTTVLPRANAQLSGVLAGSPSLPSDRTMMMGELRAAARSARAEATSGGLARAVAYEVEIQKKYALAAACVALALLGGVLALRFPRGGIALVAAASLAVFGGYYVCVVAGEALADRLLLSPFAAMWMANALLVALALLVARAHWWPGTPRGAGSLAVGGS